jgi:23S rRNA pseudouridine1911/1915/1917 synthase
MNELFKGREMQKTYWAVVKNQPAKSNGKLVHYLVKNEKQNKSYPSETEKQGSLRCELDYEVISRSDNYFLLEITPLTGRHHQIRVQLSAMGCPIKGDLKYGFQRSNPDGSIHLHARRLSFIHPVKDEPIDLVAPVPNENLWRGFDEKQ